MDYKLGLAHEWLYARLKTFHSPWKARSNPHWKLCQRSTPGSDLHYGKMALEAGKRKDLTLVGLETGQ